MSIIDSVAAYDPGIIAARDAAADKTLIQNLFDGQWLTEYVRLYVWESGRAAGLDDKTLLKLVSAYDNDASQCAVAESKENFDSWYSEVCP